MNTTNWLRQEGTFEALVVGWSLQQTKEGVLAANVKFRCLRPDGGEPLNDRPHVLGRYVILKSDGSYNEVGIGILSRVIGWSGDLWQIREAPPAEVGVRVEVDSRVWNGNTYYSVKRVYPMNRTSTDAAPTESVTRDSIVQIHQKHGAMLAKLAAEAKKPKGESRQPGVDSVNRQPAQDISQDIEF